MHEILISRRVNRNGRDAQLSACAKDTQGDFTAIGDQDFFKMGHGVNPQ